MEMNDKETWFLLRKIDDVKSWLARNSMMLETDTVEDSSSVAPWFELAQQLKQDLTGIILMFQADLQTPNI